VSTRILVIEDNVANLELMSYLLRAFGYEPQTAEDGGEGVAAARRDPPNLIICDVQLPTVDGYEVARLLKSDPALRTIPLVAVTALAMVGDRDKVLAAGFDGYITKPINPETFVRQIEGFLHDQHQMSVPASHATASTPASPPRGNDYTILVVDNLAVNIELARSILEPNGFRIIAATGVQEGLRAARQHPCDLILSDVCMDGESGYDFVQAIRADRQLAAIPFVFITSTMTNEKDRVQGLALGATRFLFRPIEPDTLLAEIKACLREGERAGHGDHSDSR
jgi:two-component system, cell cycle response regulator